MIWGQPAKDWCRNREVSTGRCGGSRLGGHGEARDSVNLLHETKDRCVEMCDQIHSTSITCVVSPNISSNSLVWEIHISPDDVFTKEVHLFSHPERISRETPHKSDMKGPPTPLVATCSALWSFLGRRPDVVYRSIRCRVYSTCCHMYTASERSGAPSRNVVDFSSLLLKKKK